MVRNAGSETPTFVPLSVVANPTVWVIRLIITLRRVLLEANAVEGAVRIEEIHESLEPGAVVFLKRGI